MSYLSFDYNDKNQGLSVREYIYKIGSFHYNWHEDIEILVILKGKVEICVGDAVHVLEEDDVLLINSNVGHATLARDFDSTAFLFRIDPRFLANYLKDWENFTFQICSNRKTRYCRSFLLLRMCMANMLEAMMDQQNQDMLLFNSNFYTLLNMLVKDFMHKKSFKVTGGNANNKYIVREMSAYIEEHYKERLSLNDIADHWGYNTSYVSQLFKKSMGINFYDYLIRKRLREATRELDRTDKKILEIAADNGFQDLKSFNTRFKKIFGMTPSEYRKALESVEVRDQVNYIKSYVGISDECVKEKLAEYKNYNADSTYNIKTDDSLAQVVKEKTLEQGIREIKEISARLQGIAKKMENSEI